MQLGRPDMPVCNMLQQVTNSCNFAVACCLACISLTVCNGGAQVWLYTPVAVQDQVLGLLQQGQYPEALDIIYGALGDGQPWAGTACAQTAMLLLHGACPHADPASAVMAHASRCCEPDAIPPSSFCLKDARAVSSPAFPRVPHHVRMRGKPPAMLHLHAQPSNRPRRAQAADASRGAAEMQWQQAALALSRCPVSDFQPGLLFPLFPCGATQHWEGAFLPLPLWELTPPLRSADELIEDSLQARSCSPCRLMAAPWPAVPTCRDQWSMHA